MTFKEKISMILRHNQLGIATEDELSEFCGFSKDTIRKAIERGTQLNRGNTRIFLDKLGINWDWWDTGKGNIFTEKHTSVQKGGDNKEESAGLDRVLDIVESSKDYFVIPRSVLRENYRLVALEHFETEKERMEFERARWEDQAARDRAYLEAYIESNKKLLDQVAQLTSQLTELQKHKQ